MRYGNSTKRNSARRESPPRRATKSPIQQLLHDSYHHSLFALAANAPTLCEQRGFDAITHLKFLQNVGHVMFNGLFAQKELLRDFAIAQPRRDLFQDLMLALGEFIERA